MQFKNLRISLFTNSFRGLVCLKYLKKKKIQVSNIIISKKNLNYKLVNYLSNARINHLVIKNLKNKKILKILKKTDLSLVCGFPHIFKKQHLKTTKYGFINLHAGKLPEYRGGSPLNWQIINNEKYFGISVIKLDKGIDTGDIICEKKFKLLSKYNIEDLHRISNNFFPKLLHQAILKIISQKKLKKQSNLNANYFHQRSLEDSFIDPKKITLKKLNLLLRATSKSYPLPYITYKNKRIHIKKFKIVNYNLNFKNKNVLHFLGTIFIKLKDKKKIKLILN